MKSYTLSAGFGRLLLWLKLVALPGVFLYIWLENLSRPIDQRSILPELYWLFWLSCAFFVVANSVVLRYFSGRAELQQHMYQSTLMLDLGLVLLLFFWHPLILQLLLGLTIVAGFYSFALQHGNGFVVWLLCTVVYCFAVFYEVRSGTGSGLNWAHSTALMALGLTVITPVCVLVKAIKRGVDNIYTATSEITYDLTSQAIEASLAHEDLLERNQEVQTLLQVIQSIYSDLNWEDLFRNLIQAFRNRFRFDKFTLYLFNEESHMLELRVESGVEKAGGPAKQLAPGTGMVGWAYVNGRGVLVQDTRSDPRFTELTERSRRIRSLACQPLIYRGQTLGVLCLDSERPNSFDDRAFSFLESIAPLLSVAVANSMSFHEIKEESFTDNLTGLKNHRGFLEIFMPLLNESYTEDFSLAVMMLDLDNFKRINDTYGHQVGNIVLIELAQILSSFFRASDLVARYGGEEFVVVLNGTPADIAPRIAESLRRKIDSHQFPISLAKDTFKQITVSIGLATTRDKNLHPDIAAGSRRGERDKYVRNLEELKEQLIENADQALYVAKREGKNQVRLSYEYPDAAPVADGDASAMLPERFASTDSELSPATDPDGLSVLEIPMDEPGSRSTG